MTRKTKWTLGISALVLIIGIVVTVVILLGKKRIRICHYKTFNPQNIVVDGIDVSHHNTVNWDELASQKNIRFAYVKAIEGRTHVDNKFKENVKAAHRNGIEVGAYLLYSNKSTPKQQFEAFVNEVDGSGCTLIPAIDVESPKFDCKNKSMVAKHIAELSDLMEQHYGKKPLLYCEDAIYRNHLRKVLPYNHLWICNYRRIPTFRDHNGYVWQFSDRQKVKGVTGYVDVNHLQSAMTMNMLKL